MYAVVAPGLHGIYYNWKDVERIHALYPYAKWGKFYNEQDAQEFIKRNTNHHVVKQLYNYGDTLSDLYIDAKYKITNECLFFVFDTKRVGRVRILSEDAVVEYKGSKIYVRLSNIKLSDLTISSHMSAIYTMLHLLGDYVDVNISLPNFSVYYALTTYSGNKSRAIQTTRAYIQ